MRILGWELWQAPVTWDAQGEACPSPGVMRLPQTASLELHPQFLSSRGRGGHHSPQRIWKFAEAFLVVIVAGM